MARIAGAAVWFKVVRARQGPKGVRAEAAGSGIVVCPTAERFSKRSSRRGIGLVAEHEADQLAYHVLIPGIRQIMQRHAACGS